MEEMKQFFLSRILQLIKYGVMYLSTSRARVSSRFKIQVQNSNQALIMFSKIIVYLKFDPSDYRVSHMYLNNFLKMGVASK